MKSKRREKGFTLMELVIGLAIAAFVTAAAAATVITMMRLGPESQNLAIALRQVQNAGYWISQDVQMSSANITVGDKQPEFLTLTVPYEASADNLTTKTILYQFETILENEWLTRTDSSTGVRTAIAKFIITDNTTANYDSDSDTLIFTITAVSGDMSVNRRYEASQRVPAP